MKNCPVLDLAPIRGTPMPAQVAEVIVVEKAVDEALTALPPIRQGPPIPVPVQ